nr:PREDICTED: homeobox protein notochord [Bos mutus]
MGRSRRTGPDRRIRAEKGNYSRAACTGFPPLRGSNAAFRMQRRAALFARGGANSPAQTPAAPGRAAEDGASCVQGPALPGADRCPSQLYQRVMLVSTPQLGSVDFASRKAVILDAGHNVRPCPSSALGHSAALLALSRQSRRDPADAIAACSRRRRCPHHTVCARPLLPSVVSIDRGLPNQLQVRSQHTEKPLLRKAPEAPLPKGLKLQQGLLSKLVLGLVTAVAALVGTQAPRPQPPALRPLASHFCGLQGLSVTGFSPARPTRPERQLLLVPFSQSEELSGISRPSYSLHCSPLCLELVHCLGLWDPRDWAQAQDLQDTERSPKRIRTMFNLEQLEELEKVFAKQHNIVGKKRAQLAAQLNLTENQVRVWFQNRRVKYQKQQRLKLPAASAMAASPDEPSSSSDTSIQREDAESGMDS